MQNQPFRLQKSTISTLSINKTHSKGANSSRHHVHLHDQQFHTATISTQGSSMGIVPRQSSFRQCCSALSNLVVAVSSRCTHQNECSMKILKILKRLVLLLVVLQLQTNRCRQNLVQYVVPVFRWCTALRAPSSTTLPAFTVAYTTQWSPASIFACRTPIRSLWRSKNMKAH